MIKKSNEEPFDEESFLKGVINDSGLKELTHEDLKQLLNEEKNNIMDGQSLSQVPSAMEYDNEISSGPGQAKTNNHKLSG